MYHYALVTIAAAGELQVEIFGLRGEGSPKVCLDRFRITRPHDAQGQRFGWAGAW
jgi:hypothetical protein